MTGSTSQKTGFTEKEILKQLDLAFQGTPNEYYPIGKQGDIKYNFFFDLEHGYFYTAGNRIHLYADANRWAIVFEKVGFSDGSAELELTFFGNCLINQRKAGSHGQYLSNSSFFKIIKNPNYSYCLFHSK